MQWLSVFIGFIGMGMDNNITIIYMYMIEETAACKKSQEQNQEKVS